MSERVNVPSGEFIRNIGYWQNEALRQPICITHHGRERLVLATPDAFEARARIEAAAPPRSDADALMENLADGYLAFDRSLHVTRCNAAAESFLGRPRDAMQRIAMRDLLPPPLDLILGERLHRVLHVRTTEAFETAVDGRVLSMRVFPLTDGVAVLLSDVTAAHDQRMRLGVGSALCAATARHPQAAAVLLDVGGVITGMHDGFCDWLGFERDDLLGQRLVDLAPAEERAGAGRILAEALESAEARQIELTLMGKLGRRVTGVLALAPIRTEFANHGVVAVLVPGGGAPHAA
jgi:PAS domain S-box-containing protein